MEGGESDGLFDKEHQSTITRLYRTESNQYRAVPPRRWPYLFDLLYDEQSSICALECNINPS